jgi:hypothetical protein
MAIADFDTFATAQTQAIAPDVTLLRTAGYHYPGDGGGASYARVSQVPQHKAFIVNTIRPPSIWALVDKHVNLLQFGAVDGGSAGQDNSEALDNALLYCKANFARSLEVPGLFRIASPVRDIDFQIEIWGQGPNRSGFFRDYDEPHPNRGLLAVTHGPGGIGSGTIIRGLGFEALNKSSGGSAISVINGQGLSLGNVLIDDVQISTFKGSKAKWGGYGLVLDGSANAVNTDDSGVALRSCKLSRLNLFGDSSGTMLLKSVRYTSVIGGMYNAVPGIGNVVVDGTEACTSQYVTIVASVLDGLTLSHVDHFSLFGSISGTIDAQATASHCDIYGRVTVPFTANWTKSGVINAWKENV